MSLQQIFIYLAAAVITVPLAKRFGLGSVLGYLIAGVIIGPSVGGWVGAGADVLHVAEYGVVMMLFLIGLELRPALLWKLRVPILGLGGSQMLAVAAAVAGIGLLLGFHWKTCIALGLTLALSSTAIVLTVLAEKRLLNTRAGQSSFSVLLFQDVSVILIIALFPLLATVAPENASAAHASGITAHLSGWQRAVITLGAVIAVVLAGRFALRPVFRIVASTGLRELFTGLTLLIIIGITLLMVAVGLSPALGAFVAGVVLADSEYRHQLETDLEPFKGLLLGLFFITVGAGLDFGLLMTNPGMIAGCVIGLILVKSMIQVILARLFGLESGSAVTFGLGLAQSGEFCFVLINIGITTGVFSNHFAAPVTATIALSMAFTPALFLLNERFIQPFLAKKNARSHQEREPDHIPITDHPVILVGFGRFGHIVGRMLKNQGVGCTVLETDPDQIELLARFDVKAYYGDATREDLLHTAGASRAKAIVITLADEEKSLAIVELVKKHHPHLTIFARAHSRQHAYALVRSGVRHVFLEALGSAVDLGVAALRDLGLPAHQAVRSAQIFKDHDRQMLEDLSRIPTRESLYISRLKEHMETLRKVMQEDHLRQSDDRDAGWNVTRNKDEE